MGCDYYADENGEFEIVFQDYETGKEIGRFYFKGNPNHRIMKEEYKGRPR